MEGVGDATDLGVALVTVASSGLVSRVVPVEVKEGVAPSAETHGLRGGSCVNVLNDSPNGVKEASRLSTVGGAFPTSEVRFLRLEIDLDSDTRAVKLSKGLMISWLGALPSASTIANRSS